MGQAALARRRSGRQHAGAAIRRTPEQKPMRLKTLCSLALLATLTLVGLPARAMDYFLAIPGIPGESTDRDHRDWIDLASFHWGLHADPDGGKPFVSDFRWTQGVDRSVPLIFLGVASGTRYDSATLDVSTRRPDGSVLGVFFQMIFEDVRLSSLDIEGDAELRAAASLGGGRLTLNYRPLTKDGELGEPVSAFFDFNKGTLSGDPLALQGLFLSGGGFDIDLLPPPVPEPATGLLLSAGLGLLLRRTRPRRSQTQES